MVSTSILGTWNVWWSYVKTQVAIMKSTLFEAHMVELSICAVRPRGSICGLSEAWFNCTSQDQVIAVDNVKNRRHPCKIFSIFSPYQQFTMNFCHFVHHHLRWTHPTFLFAGAPTLSMVRGGWCGWFGAFQWGGWGVWKKRVVSKHFYTPED